MATTSKIGDIESVKRAFCNKQYEEFAKILSETPFLFFMATYEDTNTIPMEFIATNRVSGFTQTYSDFSRHVFTIATSCIKLNISWFLSRNIKFYATGFNAKLIIENQLLTANMLFLDTRRSLDRLIDDESLDEEETICIKKYQVCFYHVYWILIKLESFICTDNMIFSIKNVFYMT